MRLRFLVRLVLSTDGIKMMKNDKYATPFLEPLVTVPPGKRAAITLVERENSPGKKYARRWVTSLPSSFSDRIVPRLAALVSVAATVYLAFTCTTHLTKPVWSLRLGRGLASRPELPVRQAGDLDVCASGQSSGTRLPELHSAAMPSQWAREEVHFSRDVQNSSPTQTEKAQAAAKPAPGHSGALELRGRKRKPGTHVGLEREEKTPREKEDVLDEPQEVQPGGGGLQLDSFVQRSSEETRHSFLLFSTARHPRVGNPSTETVQIPPPPSINLPSAKTNESVGGVVTRIVPVATPTNPALDINLETLLDDEDLIVGNWFPEPARGHQPNSHFDATEDLSDCEEVKCYGGATSKPTSWSADAQSWQSHPEGSSLPEVRAGISSIVGKAVVLRQSETKSLVDGTGFTLGSSVDPRQHPFFRLPLVPPGASVRQLNLANGESSLTIKRKPVFVLDTIRSIFLKPYLTNVDLDLLVASVERLCRFALEHMCVSLSELFPHRYLDALGEMFFVLDALYCSTQLLGENANSESWWPQLIERVKIAVSSFKEQISVRRLGSRDMTLSAALGDALNVYIGGSRPSPQMVVFLKRSLVCEPGNTKFRRLKWDPWRRDERLYSNNKKC